MKHTLPIFLTLCVVACGGSNENGVNEQQNLHNSKEPLNSQYYGNWHTFNEDGAEVYLVLSEHSVTLLGYDQDLMCMDTSVNTIENTTEHSITSTDLETNETETVNLKLSYDQLILSDDEYEIALDRYENTIPYDKNPCKNLAGIENIEFEINLAYLPEKVAVDRQEIKTGYVDYAYSVYIDINQNQIEDPSDVIVQLFNFKQAGAIEQEIALTNISTKIWSYGQLAADTNFNTNSSEIFAVQATQQGNVIKFKVGTQQHNLLKHVTAETPIKVRALINYPGDKGEIKEDEDGPWNWTSDRHVDHVPGAEQYFIPNQQINGTYEDGEGLLDEGESKWADIQSVKVTFN